MSDPTNPDVPDFENRDPNSPGFWDERFEHRFTPWDQAGVPEMFKTFVAGRQPLNVLIPGCGSAYEALYLAERGWPVRAIDFAAGAVEAARAQLGAHAGIVEEADFFTYEPPFTPGWVYERAFLCALPKSRWQDYADRMAAILTPGALLAGFFFIGSTPKGPPFGIARDELDALLSSRFELVDDREVSGSLPVFAGRERWMTWRRI
ncbi:MULTISPECIES: TPMT family class I SAM-dependent methyltransferase [unclassified Caballeronia]|uniref:TPMT family class I SAM-dependent methyltransferase n=1 Tax=unclassified Caballeronia TaxID=2646786 RepID=UPI001F323707|nr:MULTISPECIES: TPMT family class I SAM-dependent methyltransferase [unclassified Caballeronia]MCE4542924.1 TPMT family class I SAM-dependent methyltransferase [Caballeronia sp. PC1]MCE4568020.1 TPMT family class I SAM-dependent methyltransferase [Caballeronia sp. CLC5]